MRTSTQDDYRHAQRKKIKWRIEASNRLPMAVRISLASPPAISLRPGGPGYNTSHHNPAHTTSTATPASQCFATRETHEGDER